MGVHAGRIGAGLVVLGAALLAPAAGFGQSVVVVRDEGGALVRGAEVYRNCTLQGVTSGAGLLILPALAAGDHLQVRQQVETGPSAKGAHDGWSYHAWRTNISMEDDGRQVDFTVGDPSVAQNVVIRRQNTQIGWNLVGSVEYNASPANLDEIARGLQSASTYLFDVSDGQFFLEKVTLYEEREHWADADYQFFANMWPNANGSIGAASYLASPAHHMYLPGPGFNGSRAGYFPGTWPTPSGFRTFIHEHGHYGLGLGDEYYRTGGASRCTLDRDSVAETRRASIMASQYDASELCHSGNHNPLTSHGEWAGQSTWGSLAANWAGAAWTLRTPMTRGAVNPGPDALSCFAQMTPRIVPAAAEACPPLRLAARTGAGQPIRDVAVDLVHGGRRIYQGNTDRAGALAIYGGAAGDSVFLRPSATQQFCLWRGGLATVTAACGRLDITADLECFYIPIDRPFPVIRFIHEGDPAPDVYIVIPARDPGAFVRLVLEQDGLRRQEVPLAYDQKLKAFTGSFAVDTGHALEFALELATAGPKGEKIETAARLRAARFPGQGLLDGAGARPLFSADADVDVEVDAGALPEGTGVLVSETVFPPAPPQGLAAGASVATVAGETPLAKAATLSLRYDAKALVPGSVQIHRLDGGTWQALDTRVDQETGRASADIDAWGTFDVFGQPRS